MTLIDRFKKTTENFSSHTALAYLLDDQYKKITYQELDRRRLYQANQWQKFGWKRGEKVAVMLSNCPEWIIGDLAAATLGLILVPIHTTFNSEYIKKVIAHSDSKYLIIGREHFDKHRDAILSLNLDKIIIVGSSRDVQEKNVIGWPLLDLDKPVEDISVNIDEDDVHTIIYTSGTTGDPKGVMLTHKSLVSNAESAKRNVSIDQKDRFFSFLPLSHAFERMAGYYSPIFTGSSIYFARSTKTIIDDIKKAKPTMLNSVPRIFQRIYGRVFDSVESGSNFKKKLFFTALKLSVLKRKRELNFFKKIHWFILDFLVLRKVRAVLGGRMRLAISGGASLDVKILRFFENLGIDIIEGYGMTETSPIIAVNKTNNSRPGTVGHALDCNEIKIDLNKELLVKGSNVMKGYYKNDELTNETIDSEGWLHTGDLGFIDREGFLTIVGRAKDIIVLSTGKNIFPEATENILNESRYISQSMVYGDNQKHISALIVPNFDQLKSWCLKHKIDFDLSNEKIRHFYEDKVNNRLSHFAKVEQIGNFKLLEEEFSQENGLLTPTLKLKRYKIKKLYGV